MTPKMQPATPLLRHGFDQQPRQMNLPGIGVPGAGITPAKPIDKKLDFDKAKANADDDNFKKFDQLQQQRKQKKSQGTMSFAAQIAPNIMKKAQELQEEIKIDPKSNMPVIPQKIENNERNETTNKPLIIDRILDRNNEPKIEISIVKDETPVNEQQNEPENPPEPLVAKVEEVKNIDKEETKQNLSNIGNTPETIPPISLMKHAISDAEVNISEEDLCECPESNINSGDRNIIYKSFKPGLVTDIRIIPRTPGDSDRSMSSINKPCVKLIPS